MKNKKLTGLIAAPFTPMDKNGNINPDIICDYADSLVNCGVSGAFVCGTTGESTSLRIVEKQEIIEEWVRCSTGRLKIISHVGGLCQSECIELAGHALRNGADAIAAMPPYFFKPNSAEDIILFLEPVAAAAPNLPFYYYHIPSMTDVNLNIYELLSEAEKIIPNFAGVKYTHSDLYDVQQCLALKNGSFDILFGSDEILLSALSLGIESAVGSTYNFMASVYLELIEAFNNHDLQKARQHQQFSVKVVELLLKYGGGVRAGKAIMEMVGLDCGPCRLPIREVTATEKASLKNDLTEINFFEIIKPDYVVK